VDQDTKYAIANLYRQLKVIAEQAFKARCESLSFQVALSRLLPEYKHLTETDLIDSRIAEISLSAAQIQVSIDSVIREFEKTEDLT